MKKDTCTKCYCRIVEKKRCEKCTQRDLDSERWTQRLINSDSSELEGRDKSIVIKERCGRRGERSITRVRRAIGKMREVLSCSDSSRGFLTYRGKRACPRDLRRQDQQDLARSHKLDRSEGRGPDKTQHRPCCFAGWLEAVKKPWKKTRN